MPAHLLAQRLSCAAPVLARRRGKRRKAFSRRRCRAAIPRKHLHPLLGEAMWQAAVPQLGRQGRVGHGGRRQRPAGRSPLPLRRSPAAVRGLAALPPAPRAGRWRNLRDPANRKGGRSGSSKPSHSASRACTLRRSANGRRGRRNCPSAPPRRPVQHLGSRSRRCSSSKALRKRAAAGLRGRGGRGRALVVDLEVGR